MKKIERKHVLAAVVVTSLAASVVSAIIDAATAPEGEDTEAIVERHQDILLGVGILGVMMVAQSVFDVARLFSLK